MKVKDFIKLYNSIPNDKTIFIVKPLGTEKQYYNSESKCLKSEVEEMIIKNWCIIKNKVLIIVDQNIEFERSFKNGISAEND